jgi:CRP-like cAMP-binding protein
MKDRLPICDAELPARANQLLGRLGDSDRASFLAGCQQVDLRRGQLLMHADRPAAHAYLPLDAIVSLGIASAGQPRSLELALVGAEGLLGVPRVLGSSASSLRATVAKSGAAWRIAAATLRLQMGASAALRGLLQQYVLVSLAQLAQAAWCTRYHRLDGRLARWLLMMQDRAPRESLLATHEELAAALGVRRAGVTRAAAALQQRHLIVYHRGVLTLLDRAGLQAAACACYAADCASYASGMQRRPVRRE